MNILLTYNDKQREMQGWHWFDEITNLPDEKLSYCSLGLEQATVNKIFSENVLDRLSPQDAAHAVRHWTKLLAHNGVLCLVVTDFEEVARNYQQMEFDMDMVNLRLGDRRSLHTLVQLVSVLKNSGLKIVMARNEGLAAVIVARRE